MATSVTFLGKTYFDSKVVFDTHYWMGKALDIAWEAFLQEEVPVGALLVWKGQCIAAHPNGMYSTGNPLAHAEMRVLHSALATKKTLLNECDMYVTLEPCAMCAYALQRLRIKRLIFGAYDPKGGAVDHGPCIFDTMKAPYQPECWGGIYEFQCGQLLTRFFEAQRQSKENMPKGLKKRIK